MTCFGPGCEAGSGLGTDPKTVSARFCPKRRKVPTPPSLFDPRPMHNAVTGLSEKTPSGATSVHLSRSPAKVDGHGAGPHRHWAWWRLPLAPAVFNLDNPARYVNWHFFHMSVANIVVIVLMIVVFIAAIVLPFPSRGRQP